MGRCEVHQVWLVDRKLAHSYAMSHRLLANSSYVSVVHYENNLWYKCLLSEAIKTKIPNTYSLCTSVYDIRYIIRYILDIIYIRY